jgi:hypothetical protein
MNRGIEIASDVADGTRSLIVPVIHDADGKRLRALAREVSDLARRARHDREQLVGERVEERRLAGVRVADDRHRRDLVATPLCPFDLTCGIQIAQRGAKLRDPGRDPAPICLQFGFAWSTAANADPSPGTAASLPREIAAPAA